MKIRFIAGQRLPFTCNRCGAKRTGRVYRDLYEWRARLDCGHERQLGLTKPIDVLEEDGLINQDEFDTREEQNRIESLSTGQLEKLIAKTPDQEMLQWRKNVERVSTRNRTMY